jgi:transcriptional regulator with XRE-family HTH domain
MRVAEKLGTLIRDARRAAGLTQGELARRLGTTQSAVARLERGRAQPRVDTVERALGACGRRLELRAVPLSAGSIDETLVARQLRVSPGERIASFERSYAAASANSRASARSRGELA